jgi:hypothetical protein
VYVYGIVIQVLNEAGAPIPNAQAFIQEGGYVEQLKPIDEPSPSGVYQGAGERPGTYKLTVQAPGYQPQSFENLLVTAGICHVNPVDRVIVLTK